MMFCEIERGDVKMKKVHSVSSRTFKGLFDNFQYVVNNAIDDEDIKDFLLYGIKHILLKNRYLLYAMGVGLVMMVLGFLSFIGLVLFLTGLVYIGIEMIQFVSGDDNKIFKEIKEEVGISQSNIIDYVKARVNQKKQARKRRR
jgi:hypothetical protein